MYPVDHSAQLMLNNDVCLVDLFNRSRRPAEMRLPITTGEWLIKAWASMSTLFKTL